LIHSDIKLSIEPAREMLKVMCSIKKGLPWKEKAIGLLSDKGYRYMMFVKNYSRRDLMKILESLSKMEEPTDQRLVWLYGELIDCHNRLDDISTYIDELEKREAEIVSKASEKVGKYLPEKDGIEADIYLVIGGSDAYGVNLLDTRAIVIDIVEFISEIDELVAMMAHELHHKAGNRSREISRRLHRNGPKDLERAHSIVSELIGEGIATLVMFPYGLFRKYSTVKPQIDVDYEKVEEGINQISQNIIDERADEIFSSLYNNAGPIYMVGCDMAMKIEETFGREKLIDTVQEPLRFFQTFREAVTKLGEGYEFSSSTMDIIQKLQGQIDLM